MGREKFPIGSEVSGQNGADADDAAKQTSRQTSVLETYDLSCKVGFMNIFISYSRTARENVVSVKHNKNTRQNRIFMLVIFSH